MIRKIVLYMPFLILIALLFSFALGYQLIIDLGSSVPKNLVEMGAKTISPLKQFNFSSNKWKLYLVIKNSDKKDVKKWIKSKRSCFFISDTSLLQKLSNDWEFHSTGGDIATASSYIVLYENGKRKFESGIILDEQTQGLQNRYTGWIVPIKKGIICQYLMYFKPTNYPIIILN